MIFFGLRGKVLKGEVVEGLQCPSCGNSRFFAFGVLRYFHLYWIPTILTAQKAGVECVHCKKTLMDKELPAELENKIKASLFTKKKTLPMFSGLMILFCVVLVIVIVGQRGIVQQNAYLEQPAVNDLYIVDMAKIFPGMDHGYQYGIMRIKSISSGQLEMQISKVIYNKTSGLQKDMRAKKTSADAYYGDVPFYVEISDLKDMKQAGAIYSVDRN